MKEKLIVLSGGGEIDRSVVNKCAQHNTPPELQLFQSPWIYCW